MVNNGVSFQGDTVELMSDINLEGSESNPNWNSIGGQNIGKAFSGIFEGNNHKISNVNGEIGFFGKVTNGTIQNLGIESGSITSRRLIWWNSCENRKWKNNKLL